MIPISNRYNERTLTPPRPRDESLRLRNPLSSSTRINQYVSRYLHRKLDTPGRTGQRSSIARFQAEKHVESFPTTARKGSDIMITRVFTLTVGIAGDTDVPRKSNSRRLPASLSCDSKIEAGVADFMRTFHVPILCERFDFYAS